MIRIKNWLLIIAFFGTLGQLWAQNPVSKMNLDLFHYWQANRDLPPTNAPVWVELIAKGDLAEAQKLTRQAGGRYKYGLKNLSAVTVPIQSLPLFLQSPRMERIESQRAKMQKLNTFREDTITQYNNNLTPAHAGTHGLPQAYKGQGVLVGIIDDGFELAHPDFWQADSSTRVAFLWDQTQFVANYPEPIIGYGATWSAAQINAGACTQIPKDHGTHVAGIAAGNGRAANKFVGVAPESELLYVKMDENSPAFLSNFVDALYWIGQKSTALGKPCAVNSSVGTYFGSHDGKDLHTELIEAILDAHRGLVLVQAAGNARQFPFHLGVNLQNDTAYTWFRYHAGARSTLFVAYADTFNLDSIEFSLQRIDNTNFSEKLSTIWFNTLRDFSFQNGVGTRQEFLYMDASQNPVYLYLSVSKYKGVYELFVNIPSATMTDYWQFKTKGKGKYDIWSSTGQIGTSDMVAQGQGAKYKSPDNAQTLVSSWACSDKVITVGSYQNQNFMIRYAGDTFNLGTAGFPQFGISHFSSLGYTRDGRQKPDICASGGQVLSAMSLRTINSCRLGTCFTHLDAAGWHLSDRGTSMSAPLVAGAVGLYLQCQPQADYAQVKQALQASARVDSFVLIQNSQIPNQHWGYGKLDILGLLQQCLVSGCTDSTALNYNPLANVENGTCLFPIVGVEKNTSTPNEFSIYPNPSSLSGFYYTLPSGYEGANLEIYTAEGRLIHQIHTSSSKDWINLPPDWAQGFYAVVLRQSQKPALTRMIRLGAKP